MSPAGLFRSLVLGLQDRHDVLVDVVTLAEHIVAQRAVVAKTGLFVAADGARVVRVNA
jgi:hypothetical protein